jgi:hypothetical protein
MFSGTATSARNIIAFNCTMCAPPNDIGVAIGGAGAINNAVLGNSIFGNGGLGIDPQRFKEFRQHLGLLRVLHHAIHLSLQLLSSDWPLPIFLQGL